MLIYYDDHVVLTEDTLNYGQWSEKLSGPIKRAYDVNNFLLIFCGNYVHVYCKKNRQHDRAFCFKNFIVNSGKHYVRIIDPTNANLVMMIGAIILHRNKHNTIINTDCHIMTCNLEDDLDPIVLRTAAKEPFWGHLDIIVRVI